MKSLKTVTCLVLLSVFCISFALPPLVPYSANGLNFKVPQGWSVEVDETGSYVMVAENPNDPSAAAMVLIAVPYQAGMTADFLTDAVLEEVAPVSTELSRQEENGFIYTLYELDNEDGAFLLTSLAYSSEGDGIGIIGLLSAEASQFEALGGTALLLVSFLGADPAMFSQAATPLQRGKFPELEPIAELGGQYQKPKGWHYTAEQNQGQDLIYLLENPSDPTTAAIFWMNQQTQGSAPAGTDVVSTAISFFLESLAFESVSVERQSGDMLSGARMIRASRGGVPHHAWFIVMTGQDYASVYGIFAPTERFNALGGHGLLWLTLLGKTLQEVETTPEIQSWYQEPSFGSGSMSSGDYAMQQMYLDMQDRMFKSWSNNMSSNGWCWADSYGQCY